MGKAQVASPKNNAIDDTLVVDNGSKDSVKIFRPTIADYQQYTLLGQKKSFDTTFSVQKSYQLTQYNNRDNFGKIQFANVGSGFQNLTFRENKEQYFSVLPTNKSHFIIPADEVKYYNVKTPTTQFIYHTAMAQGAALQSTYTQNFGENFNFSVEYMGLRSKGFYTNSLAYSNNTIFSAHYISPNKKYEAFAHYIHQNINNEENGGISDLVVFTSGDSRFNNRLNLSVNLQNSDSRFSYRRYFFSHSFRPFASEKFPFKVRHTLYHQGNKYYFNLGNSDTNFYPNTNIQYSEGGKKFSDNLSNTISIIFDNDKFKLDAGLRHQLLTLGYKNAVQENNPEIHQTENRIGAVGNLGINLWEKFALKSHLEFSQGSKFGTFLLSENQVKFEPIKDYFVDAVLNFRSSIPSFNALVNSTPVTSGNYDIRNFNNENVLEIGGTLGLKWFNTQLFAKYLRVGNYTYFDNTLQPKQADTSLNISQLGGEATFSYRKFHLNTRVLVQNNLTNNSLYPIPNVVGRANLYWQGWAFKKSVEIMTGVKAYYFTKFNSRDYSPILNEFVLPGANSYAIGGHPIADAYFNFRVKTMQFYVEAQHFSTTFMQNKSYTAPYYPIYDFRLNIGIIWNLFH